MYDLHPSKPLNGNVYDGYPAIIEKLQEALAGYDHAVLTLDFYHGVSNENVLTELIDALSPNTILFADAAKKSEEEIQAILGRQITDDRVFGILTTEVLDSLFDPSKVEELRSHIGDGLTIIYGVGASLIHPGDVHVYFDITRWEIQLRYRAGMDNWGAQNYDDDILRKYKRGYFVEWRIFDRYKFKVLPDCDFYVDASTLGHPKMIDMDTYKKGMNLFSTSPFRLVPYFDEGVWGGTWMQEHFGLEPKEHNYAWCFDGVPEENSICLKIKDTLVDIPAINLVHAKPNHLLGRRVHARFGKEFPIRFDFLDTIHGGNLSLQVHPLTEYIQEHFGMHYTQDESYYILDAQPDAHVYLGLKEGVDFDAFIDDLHTSQETGCRFPDEKYINNIPVKKHDHVLIPAGTIHCSGAGTVVLEISATPYIFTFKLYDWGRVGLDSKPRPVNIERGKENIQQDRTTSWIMHNLIHREKVLEEKDNYTLERTGLHELEFIDTLRYSFDERVTIEMDDSVNMLNLVEGEAVQVVSPTQAFEPYTIHYAETFIVPASVQTYQLVAMNGPVKVIRAKIRK